MNMINSVLEICTWKKLSGSIPSFYKLGNQDPQMWTDLLKDAQSWGQSSGCIASDPVLVTHEMYQTCKTPDDIT